MVTYERDSDDDEHSEEEESNEDDHDQDDDDDASNSNSGPISNEAGGIDLLQQDTTLYTKQIHITSDLSNATSVSLISFALLHRCYRYLSLSL